MSDNIYTRLREFMDRLPGGYPKTPSGVEMRILKKLFTPEDAELVMKLSHEPEELSAIAKRIGMDESQLSDRLEELCSRGLIYRLRQGDRRSYLAFQFVVGIYEFQLKRLDREFAEMFEEYIPFLGANMMALKTRQMRVIPVESAVGTGGSVAPYNQVREMVKKETFFAVQECICRKEQALLGNECDHPKEICLGFGDFGRFYVDNGWAREISMDESLSLLDRAEEAGLVLSPGNMKNLLAICCCCTCCCPLLRFAKMTRRPQDILLSQYAAQLDRDLCTDCGECIERCPMDAYQEVDGVTQMVDGRCIGCGLCVATCPNEAISLVARPAVPAPFEDFQQLLTELRIERGIS
jgi:electron transport complex protein RnfB